MEQGAIEHGIYHGRERRVGARGFPQRSVLQFGAQQCRSHQDSQRRSCLAAEAAGHRVDASADQARKGTRLEKVVGVVSGRGSPPVW